MFWKNLNLIQILLDLIGHKVIVRKFKFKYGEGDVKKYYMKFDVAAEVHSDRPILELTQRGREGYTILVTDYGKINYFQTVCFNSITETVVDSNSC